MGAALIAAVLVAAFPQAGRGAASQAQPFRDRVKASIDVGVKYLRFQQEEDAAWDNDVEATALIVRVMMESHRKYRESDGPFISGSLRYLAAQAREDGSLSNDSGVYLTALAVRPFVLSESDAYRTLTESAIDHLTRSFAGAGGSDGRRAELDPGQLALVLDALTAARVPRSEPMWDRLGAVIDAVGAPDTAALLYCRLRLGGDDPDLIARRAVTLLQTDSPLGAAGSPALTGSFRDVYFLAATLDAAGELPPVRIDGAAPRAWQEIIAERLMELQRFEGYWIGEHTDSDAGRYIASSFALLALEQIYNP